MKLYDLQRQALSLLNHRLRVYRRVIVRPWMLLILVLAAAGLCVRVLFRRSLDLAGLEQMEFEERFSKQALQKLPMSERPIASAKDAVFESGCRDPLIEAKNPRMNAAFVVLARNSEIDGVVSSMRSLERHFNQWFNYPWIFLNNERFTQEFKKKVAQVSSGPVRFGTVPEAKWKFDEQQTNPVLFKEAIESQGDREIMYGNTASYHNMCRFYSGYFFKHPLVRKLDWYWRVEPDVDFYCDLTYDPFVEMQMRDKKYGFTVAIKELVNTVPNLFRHTNAFIKKHDVPLSDAWEFFVDRFDVYKGQNSEHYRSITNRRDFWKKLEERVPMYHALQTAGDDAARLDQHSLNKLVDHSNKRGLHTVNKDQFDGTEYNLCHFWSNFEIARTDLFTSELYQQYFDYVESSQGFFIERWGDAPVHSLGAGMFLNLSEIHYFRDIGYKHSTLGHCPKNSPRQLPYQPGARYKHVYHENDERNMARYDTPVPEGGVGVGCRCKCPADHAEIENSGGSCVALWAKLTADEREADVTLDLDAIEARALEMYEQYLGQHGNDGSKWKLSAADREELEKLGSLEAPAGNL
ncbi:hypothetical protein KL928_001463 [Ogataea angusta]|uniref:Mannosyltransferase n=1 Tax=Pichia angusta TaxID=870730 RepID=A0AAN6I6G2_PICAN|nr:uncharacterized protein KL928_001463 [Ogataea angusta]KAG7820026.1 hypothetical protein KL928_001463 [Ogataea angusta]